MTISSHSGDHRTLVVDDHGTSRRWTVAVLQQCAGAVRRARTAIEALDIALTWHPDLICMDIRLPDIGGLEVIRRIRSSWPLDRSQPRIIVLTADDSTLNEGDLAALDIECLLLKPVSGSELRKASGLSQNRCISEPAALDSKTKLRKLFRLELVQSLPELDDCFSNFDLSHATGILHRLIASSAMCDEEKLEASIRALDDSCRRAEPAVDLAQAYYDFLDLADDYLHGPDTLAD